MRTRHSATRNRKHGQTPGNVINPPTRARHSATRTTQTRSPGRVVQGWLMQHQRALHHSLRQLLRQPLSSLMTIMVIGISLALPTSFLLALSNLEEVFSGWGRSFEISVFLKTEIHDQQGLRLAEQLRQDPTVTRLRFIDKEEALEEFRQLSGFPEAVEALNRNPLPGVILLHPRQDADRTAREALIERLRSLPEVDQARFDRHWAWRMQRITELLRRSGLLLAGLFILAVPLVIGNTIRLGVLNQREEIRIHRLFGASTSFIQRPFLYTGLWFGLGGGLMSWGMIATALMMLQAPANELAESYNSSLSLQGLSWTQATGLVSLGILLSLAGAWVSVHRYIRSLKI